MKFLCDQCKAKYQIDDSKVAGKTVRMKCRKCGHVIEIRAAVTESSQATKERSMSLGQQPGIAAPPRRAAPPARTSVAPNALASAFNKNVATEPAKGSTPPPEDPSSNDEWYVAINGVPVGPIGMSELRRKVASGSVTETSLAWREGLEEWRVVRAIPELASLLRETGGSVRPGAVVKSSVKPPAPRDPGPSMRPSKPPPPRNNVIPLRGGPGGDRSSVNPAAASIGGAGAAAAMYEDLAVGTDPFAAPAPAFTAADPFAAPVAAAAVAPASAGKIPSAAPAAFAAGRASSHSMIPLQPAKKPTPWGPIAMVAMAVAFGVTGGVIAFLNRNQQVVQVPGPTQTIIVQVPGAPAAPTGTTADPVASASASAKGAGAAVAAGPKPTATASASASGGAANLAGLLGGGPSGPSGPGQGGGGGGSSLTQSDIENTVRNYQPGVKRRCWDSAQQTSSVNVMASVTVGGDGSVQSVSASGNDPSIARCIETQIRGWRFPVTGGRSQFNVPFKFVRQ